MTMTRKKCWICGRPVYSKISDICRPCERAWRVLVLKERGEENIDECYGCTWKGAPRDLFPCSECRGSVEEGPDWYSPAGEPLIYRNDDIPAGETEKDSSDLISRQAAIEAIASRDETDGTVKVFTGREVNEILSALPSADRPTGWIPVSERLPSGQENVIVTIYDDHGDTPWEYTTNAWHIDGVWIADNDIVCGSVIAWMPLPEPYREDGEA